MEIDANSAATASEVLAERQLEATIQVDDFFDISAEPRFDAVIGNPPYIRYQRFTGIQRAKGAQAALAHGVRLDGLASSWAPFVIHAAQFLKPEGRMGMVLPAELLSVNYAAQVRRFLLKRFADVRVVLFEKRVFSDALADVVLLLAEGSGGASKFEVYQARDMEDLENLDASAWTRFAPEEGEKWTPALLSADSFSRYQGVLATDGFESLVDWGETYLGTVTGNNKFFALTLSEAEASGIPSSEFVRISPPGSRHLRGVKFSEATWRALATEGRRCLLFSPDPDLPSKAALEFIRCGERQKVHLAYKCRVRRPWWRVPLVRIPDLLFTYMNHERPHLTVNDARTHILNSVYGILLRRGRKKIGRELLCMGSLNSVTLLGAEIVGRSYGGGMLKHEPTEADRLPLPSSGLLQSVAKNLRSLRPQLSGPLRRGDISSAVTLVDKVVLKGGLGLSTPDIDRLRQARELLFRRRTTRGQGGRGKN